MEIKYVAFDGYIGEQIIVFPGNIQHLQFAESVYELSYRSMKAISGGFIEDGKCVGKSISLNMESRGDKDTALLKVMIDK